MSHDESLHALGATSGGGELVGPEGGRRGRTLPECYAEM